MNPSNQILNHHSGYLCKASLCTFIGGKDKPIGKSTINDWMRNKNFPRPIRLSQTLAVWSIAEVVQWLELQRNHHEETQSY